MFPETAVILAGGLGTRVKKYLKGYPKSLLKIENKFFLEILIRNLVKYNFKKIIILSGYRGNKISNLYNNKVINFTKIECIREKKLMGTGGALSVLKNKIKNNFFLLNGDTYCDVDLRKIFFKNKKSLIKILLTKNNNKNNLKLNNLAITNELVTYSIKSNFMNAGIYLIKKEFLKIIQNTNSSLENDIIPDLIKNNLVEGIYVNFFFYDIGTPKNFRNANFFFKKYLLKPAAIFDRDGVINHDKNGYTYKTADFRFRKNVIKTINFLNKKNYYVFIITNQSGIGRGYYTLNDFYCLHSYVKKILINKSSFIHDVKFCPHHPKAKIKIYKKNCLCRKPNNLLFKEILQSYFINLDKSFMIGDNSSDEQMAIKSNLYFEYIDRDLYKQIKRIIN
jgi:D-glycero-D-manno-heptose 1,7-bisphosphate phosphatase